MVNKELYIYIYKTSHKFIIKIKFFQNFDMKVSNITKLLCIPMQLNICLKYPS